MVNIPVDIEKKVHATTAEIGNWISLKKNFAANTMVGKLTRQSYCQNIN
jgi:hypothetical protein